MTGRFRPTTTRRQPGRWAPITAAWLAAGCSLVVDVDARVENRCGSDDDCERSGGLRCDRELGMCVRPPERPMRVLLTVAAAEGRDHAAWLVGPFEVAAEGWMDLPELPPIVTVFGTTRYRGERVAARVRLRRVPPFDGAPELSFEAPPRASALLAADEREADYELRVAAGADYDVLVEPTGEQAAVLPPLRRRIGIPTGGTAARLDLDWPAELVSIRGVVVDADGVPLGGLQVRAVDAAGELLSSTAITSVTPGSSGSFEIRLTSADAASSFLLRLNGGPERPLFPTMLVDPAYLIAEPETGGVRVLVPRLEPIRYAGIVERASGERVAGATVELVAELHDSDTGVRGSFRTMATTVADGSFEAMLLPARYEVVVTPPAPRDEARGSADAVLVESLRIERPATGELSGQLFTLPRAARLGGSVTAGGRPLADATVHAAARGTPLPEVPAARFNRSRTVVTDRSGAFRADLDAGAYDVTVRPPPDSGFPWHVVPDLATRADLALVHEVAMSAPVPVGGRLRSADGSLGGAEVRVWVLHESDAGPPRGVEVARATTDPRGELLLLLPAALGR
ncbi:MAG: carboxypeptidase-like regulatory domain-containing protein [Myxococcota bacterium]|nr:carboxypeptidase-like regulatory domain-containing protein [Myxococcota bacterium]MDW8363642.1 carboxypeptidase-like regulatory domain-containing protein [Myxococcales bacterium]